MEIGKFYLNAKTLFGLIPLTLPDLDGNFIGLQIDIGKYTLGEDIKTTEKANAYLESKVALYPAYLNTKTIDIEKYDLTYVPKTQKTLYLGDAFMEAKGKVKYDVIGFFTRSVATDPIKANAPKAIRNYPFGIDLKPLLNYLERVEQSKEGLAGLFENGNVWKKNELSVVMALIYKNTKLAYWNLEAPKPTNVAFIKQPKPKEKLPELKIQQPVAVGDRQTTAFPLFAFGPRNDAHRDRDFQLGHNLTIEQVEELTLNIQNLNYVSPQVPKMPKTGNIFLDEFYFAFIDFMPMVKNINMGGFEKNIDLNFRLLCKSKTPNTIYENYGYHVDFQNTYTGKLHGINLQEIYYEYDYSRLFEINELFDGVNNFKSHVTYTENDLGVNSIATFPPLYYVGQGRFSCLQGNDPNDPNDKYGVGDTFTVTQPTTGGSVGGVMVYMYYAHNKKGEKVKMGVFVETAALQQIFDGQPASIRYFHAEIGVLDKVVTNHKSYFDYRKTLKDFYLAGQVQPLSSTPSASPFQGLKDMLGEEYDDAFLAAVQGLDWVKIAELQKENPEIIEPIKELIRQSYVRYVIEKAKNPKAMQKASMGRKDAAKYFIKIPANNNIIESAEYANKVLGEKLLQQASFWASTQPKPEMSLQDIPTLVSQAMGSFDIKWTMNEFEFQQILTFQENKEPLLIQNFISRGDATDGEFRVSYNGSNFDNFLTYRNQNKTNNHWIADGDYYHAYAGFKIMYYLWRVGRVNAEPLDAEIKPTKHKKIAPMILSDVGINYLRYMNRWGFFTTPEEIHDTVKKLWNNSSDYNYPSTLGSYIVWMFTSTNANRTEDLLAKQRTLLDAITNENKVRFDEFLSNKDSFCQYMNSLPIDWGNTDASYMEEPQSVAPSKPTRKKKEPKAITQPPAPTGNFKWMQEPWENALADDVQTAFNILFGIRGKKVRYCSFEAGYKTPNDPAERFILLEFPIVLNNNIYGDFCESLYDKYSKDIDATALEVSYPILQETRNKNLLRLNMYCREADYGKVLADIIGATYGTATPPAPTSSFKWLQEPWSQFFKPQGLEGFKEEYGLNDDAEAKLAAFEAEYPTAGSAKDEFTMVVLKYNTVDPAKRDAWMELANKLVELSNDVEYATILNEYPQVREALNAYNPTNYYIFKNKNMYQVYAALLQRQFQTAVSTKFTWIDEPWIDALIRYRQLEFNKAYGLPFTYSIRACSFAAGYPTALEPSQRFSMFAFPMTMVSKVNVKIKELLLELTKKYENGKFERQYLVAYEQVKDALIKLGNDPYDFVFCKSEDYNKLIEDIIESIQTAAPAKNQFQWIDKPWRISLRKKVQEDFNSFYQLPSDAVIQDCSFEAGYPTPNDPKEKFVLFAIPFDDKTEALYHQLSEYEKGFDWNGLMKNNPEIGQAINNQTGEFYRFFCRENDYMNVIMDIQESIAKAAPVITTPPAPKPPAPKPPKPTTPKTPKPKKPDLSKLSNISFDDI